MPDNKPLIQQALVDQPDNDDPEYKRLMNAYSDNPFHDITKDSIKEYTDKKEPDESALSS